jgi:hypothetical protein
MPEARKRPCFICRRWFRPDPRVGDRQHACGNPECQTVRRQKTQASWHRRNPDYAIAYRLDQRAAQTQPPPEALRLPVPLNQLPWEFAKDQFGAQGADFIGLMGALLIRAAKDQFRAYLIDPAALSGTLPLLSEKTSPSLAHTQLQTASDATGISPTRPPMGTSASPRAAPAAPSAGLAG